MTYADAIPQPKSGSLLGVLCFVAASFSAAVLAALGLYLLVQDSNHSAYEPWLLLGIFVPTLILGIIAFRSPRFRRVSTLACLLGMAGIAVLVYLDRFNVLLQYERWIERGMP